MGQAAYRACRVGVMRLGLGSVSAVALFVAAMSCAQASEDTQSALILDGTGAQNALTGQGAQADAGAAQALPGMQQAALPPLPTFALALPVGAIRTVDETEEATSYSLPISPWLGTGTQLMQADGQLDRRVWQIPDYNGNASELMATLRAQIEAAGYQAVFACDTTLCGGFDFRFAMDVSPEPAMHVDLGDFTYLVASATGAEGTDVLGLLVSRGGGNGYVHLVRVSPAQMSPMDVSVSTRSPDAAQAFDLATMLETDGRAPLEGLSFATGASTLSDGTYPALQDLAQYLADHPDATVVLVGHTDAEGTLENNIALSRARAGSVRDYLVTRFGVSPDRLQAEGVGYLAPRATNSDVTGRQMNRRVEVVLTSTR